MTEDRTHAEAMDSLHQHLDRLSQELAGSNTLLASQIRALGERHEGAIERLEAGGARFVRLEQLMEQSASDRAELRKELASSIRRLTALEAAKMVIEGVDDRLTERAMRWRRRLYSALIFVFGNGTGLAVFVWYLERHPPGAP